MNEVIKNLNWRYATKKFDATKKISQEDITTINEALRLTASGFGMQPWKFVWVENTEIREKLVPVSYGQMQVQEASHLLVLCARTDLHNLPQETVEATATATGAPVEALDGYKSMMQGAISNPESQLWADKQVYIALGNILTVLGELKIDSCPMEGFDAHAYDEILGLKDKNCHSVVILPLGYRSADDGYAARPKTRFSHDTLFINI